jgi:menaquinone-dependent protoporphyrinogen oxidase
MTRVLVAYASKMGATKEIADAIGGRLGDRGCQADVRSAGAVTSVDAYDAVVLGSAVYVTRWRREAVRFARRFRKQLAARRVWLFESGWVGTRPEEPEPSAGARRTAARVGARTPAVFGGRLDPELATGFLDRRLAREMAGDARDWGEITAWADEVADTLTAHDQGEAKGGRR